MPQQNPILQQQVQVKEKTQTMQKVVLGVGILCAFTALLNFSFVFNSGVSQLAKQITNDSLSRKSIIINNNLDENRDLIVQMALNRDLNDLQTFTTGQDNATFLAVNLNNYSTSTLELEQLRFLAYVDGGSVTSSTSTLNFTPGGSALDGGVNANQLVWTLKLYKYENGQPFLIDDFTPSSFTAAGYVSFDDFSLVLPPAVGASSSVTTLLLKGEVRDWAPFGQYPDYISFDINDWRNDIFIYDSNNHRISVTPNQINHGNSPYVYHEITVPNAPPSVPTGLQGYGNATQNWINWNMMTGYGLDPYYFVLESHTTAPTSTPWGVVPNGGYILNTVYVHTNLMPETTYQYRLKSCYKVNNQCSSYTNPLTITTPQGISLNFWADPTVIPVNASSTLNWSFSTTTGLCWAWAMPTNAQWTGNKNAGANNSQVITNLTTTTNFHLNCSDYGSAVFASTTVEVISP